MKYKRLTNGDFDGQCSHCHISSIKGEDGCYNTTEGWFMCCKNCEHKERYDRLRELEDKIEDGTLVELPCEVGDMVYGYSKNVSRIIYGRLDSIHITDRGVHYTVYEDDGIIQYWLDKVSKTKAEAEKRLEELRDENKEE